MVFAFSPIHELIRWLFRGKPGSFGIGGTLSHLRPVLGWCIRRSCRSDCLVLPAKASSSSNTKRSDEGPIPDCATQCASFAKVEFCLSQEITIDWYASASLQTCNDPVWLGELLPTGRFKSFSSFHGGDQVRMIELRIYKLSPDNRIRGALAKLAPLPPRFLPCGVQSREVQLCRVVD
jgi:hypothetical protein